MRWSATQAQVQALGGRGGDDAVLKAEMLDWMGGLARINRQEGTWRGL